jgi:CheY-like chemotaxis protein
VGTLAGGIAHDFNNLLQIISGHAELLLMEAQDDNTYSEEPQAIKQAADRGADLVRKILTFSRKVDIQLKPVNLNDIVKSEAELLYRTIPRMIAIETDLSDDLKTIEASPNQIDQIILNLAINAKDAMPNGGTLSFHTSNVDLDEEFCQTRIGLKPGPYVLLKVSDNGVGISRDNVKHVFEPFFTTKKPGEGSGLGLSTVFGVVSMHRGWVEIESSPGQGAQIFIYFPASGHEPTFKTDTESIKPKGGSETILIVDDEAPVRKLVKSILEKAGYSVLTASNGKEALEIYSRHGSDIALVVLDLIMPEMGGDTCLERLHTMDPNVRTLIMSGFGMDEKKEKLLQEKQVRLVSKPFDMIDFLNVVRQTLDRTGAQKMGKNF